jgi:hypothetical protein
MNKSTIISGAISLSLLLSVFSAKKIIDANIKKDLKQKVAVEQFFKSYPYKLSSSNREAAQRIVDRLYSDTAVFNKMYDFYKYNVEANEKLLKVLNNSSLNTEASLKILESKNKRFQSLVKELYTNKDVKKNLDSLFTLFSTNPLFKNKFNVDLLQAQLKKNPIYLIDKGFIFKRKPTLEKNISTQTFDYKNRVKNFQSKLESDLKKKKIIRRGPRG